MSIGGRLFAATYDNLMKSTEEAGLHEHRVNLLHQAGGRVLEIGGGTGANVPLYGPGVESLTITEPEQPMVKRLQRRVSELGSEALVLRAPAEDLPFEDDSFDVAVTTLVLCTVDDQPRALRELHRVLRPGGKLLYIEHVRAEQEGLARWQDRLNGIGRIMCHGCNCNRPTLRTIGETGFKVTVNENGELAKAPPWVRPMIVGVAERNGVVAAA